MSNMDWEGLDATPGEGEEISRGRWAGFFSLDSQMENTFGAESVAVEER